MFENDSVVSAQGRSKTKEQDSFIVYSLPLCSQCRALKKKLTIAGIEFEEIVDEERIISISEKTGIMTAPITEVGGKFYDYFQIVEKYGV